MKFTVTLPPQADGGVVVLGVKEGLHPPLRLFNVLFNQLVNCVFTESCVSQVPTVSLAAVT